MDETAPTVQAVRLSSDGLRATIQGTSPCGKEDGKKTARISGKAHGEREDLVGILSAVPCAENI